IPKDYMLDKNTDYSVEITRDKNGKLVAEVESIFVIVKKINSESEKPITPPTGDTTAPILQYVVIFIASIAITAIIIKKRKYTIIKK
ncbi:MAG: hypothetical protein RR246_05485, partial [Clostridia bacterium]